MAKYMDLTGQCFGKLLVLEKSHSKNGRLYWKCRCICGTETVIRGSNLKTGHSTTCGRYECGGNKAEDLTGKRFGALVVIEREKNIVGTWTHTMWKCRCDCGKEVIVRKTCLKNGETRSCGCIKSFPEITIAALLQEAEVTFKQQTFFPDLISAKGAFLYFDFSLYNSKNQLVGLIEYNGEQHYDSTSPWYSEEGVLRDQQKVQYSKSNNIPLLVLQKEMKIKEVLYVFLQSLSLIN